jgi:hypothetical protein
VARNLEDAHRTQRGRESIDAEVVFGTMLKQADRHARHKPLFEEQHVGAAQASLPLRPHQVHEVRDAEGCRVRLHPINAVGLNAVAREQGH